MDARPLITVQGLDDGDMATDQFSTVESPDIMPTAPVRPGIVNAQITRHRIPRVVGVANPIGKTRFAREKQEMEEKSGKLILTNEKNKEEEENIASSGSSISAAKVEEGFDKEELHRAKVEGFDKERPVAAPQRHPVAVLQRRQRRAARREPVAVLQHRQRKKAARQSFLDFIDATIVCHEALRKSVQANLDAADYSVEDGDLVDE